MAGSILTGPAELVSRRNLWIISPTADLLFVIGTPIFLMGMLLPLSWHIPDASFPLVAVGVLSIGHHLPGFMRVYGDRELFGQYWFRATVVPPLLFAIVYWINQKQMGAVTLTVVLWGFWHGLMQIYGFMRIYDSKVGRTESITARLDWLICASSFVVMLLWSPTSARLFTEASESTGLLYFSIIFQEPVKYLGMAGFICISTIYAGHTIWRFTSGQPVSLMKLMMLLVTIVFLYFSWVIVENNVWLGLGAWEIFHDIQYFAIVWSYNSKLTNRSACTPFIRFLFRPQWLLLAGYIVLVVGYGGFQYVPLENEYIVPSLLATSVLLHFYFDGFIWKVRHAKTRRDMGLVRESVSPGEGQQEPETARTSWTRDGFHLVCMICPLILMTALESRYVIWEVPMRESLVRLIPDSSDYRVKLGDSYFRRGRNDDALNAYQMAVKIDPQSARGYYSLGLALRSRGDRDGDEQAFRETIRLSLGDDQHSVNKAPPEVSGSLAMLYVGQGQPERAINVLRKTLQQGVREPFLADLLSRTILGMQSDSNQIREAQKWASVACRWTQNRDARFLHSLARAHMKLGEMESASNVLFQAQNIARQFEHLQLQEQIKEMLLSLPSSSSGVVQKR